MNFTSMRHACIIAIAILLPCCQKESPSESSEQVIANPTQSWRMDGLSSRRNRTSPYAFANSYVLLPVVNTNYSVFGFPLLGSDDYVRIQCSDQTLRCIDDIGNVQWDYKLNNGVNGNGVLDLSDNFVSPDGYNDICSINALGKLNWVTNVSNIAGTYLLEYQGNIVVPSSDGHISLLGENGALLWQRKIVDTYYPLMPIVTGDSVVVYIPGAGLSAVSLDTGKNKWRRGGLFQYGDVEGTIAAIDSSTLLLTETGNAQFVSSTGKGLKRAKISQLKNPCQLALSSDLILVLDETQDSVLAFDNEFSRLWNYNFNVDVLNSFILDSAGNSMFIRSTGEIIILNRWGVCKYSIVLPLALEEFIFVSPLLLNNGDILVFTYISALEGRLFKLTPRMSGAN